MKKDNLKKIIRNILKESKNYSVHKKSLLNEQPQSEKEASVLDKVSAVGKDMGDSWDIETMFIKTPFGEIKVPVGTTDMIARPNSMKPSDFRKCELYDDNYPPEDGQYRMYTVDGKQQRLYCPTFSFISNWFANNGDYLGFMTPDKMEWTVVLERNKSIPLFDFYKIAGAPELYEKTQYKDSRGWQVGGFYNCITSGDLTKCIPYDADIMTPKSFTEKYLPILLNIASVIIAIIPGVGWIGLAIALSLDLAAAGIQGYYGDTVGAAISVLLSLVPFIGSLKSIAKYPQSVYNNLAKKFANAANEDEVIRIFAGLDDPLERKAMSDLLTNPGTIESAQWQYKLAQEVNSTSKNEVLKFLKNKGKADKIIKMTKELSKEGKIVKDKIPVWATTGMAGAAKEIGVSAPLIYAEIQRQPDEAKITATTQDYQTQKIVQSTIDPISKGEIKIVQKPKEERLKVISRIDSVKNEEYKTYQQQSDSLKTDSKTKIDNFWND